jgi:dolichol-phosphate mannosyltransferase
MPNIMVVIPTYNEADNLPRLIDALLSMSAPKLNLLVVDDNSPDGTGQIADELAAEHPGRISVLHRQGKLGLGPAYIAGFKQALAQGADYIIQMDADFSHQPSYIPKLVATLEAGADVVIASRFMRGGGVDKSWSLRRKLLSWWANSIYVRLILGIPVSDATAGYRIWRRETLIGLDLDRIRSNGYAFQVEMGYVAYRLGYTLGEIPIYFPDRRDGTSKMDMKIPIEAAVRVWQMKVQHQSLTRAQRRTALYEVTEPVQPADAKNGVPTGSSV